MKHSISRHTVPRETFDTIEALYEKHHASLEQYVDLLLWWNERINLVSRDVPRETIVEHITHSMLIYEFNCFKRAEFVVDTGTGGGLPGLPLAITNPEKSFLLNDIVSKKVMAVKQIVQKLSLNNIDTFDGSIAELETNNPLLLISKHAFKINDLFQLTESLPWTSIVFYKGVGFEDELNGIDIPLSISVYELFPNSKNNFYKDKALVIVSR